MAESLSILLRWADLEEDMCGGVCEGRLLPWGQKGTVNARWWGKGGKAGGSAGRRGAVGGVAGYTFSFCITAPWGLK